MGRLDIYECNDCGFEFRENHSHFYLDLKTGQIEDFMILKSTLHLDRNSPLKGKIVKTYCGNCNTHISIYEIKSIGENYNLKSACYLLRLLLPKKINWMQYKVQTYKKLEEIVKERNIKKINNFIKSHAFFLEEIDTIDSLDDLEYMDIESYKDESIDQLNLIRNTVFSIHLPNSDYNLSLNGEKIAKDVCPNCNGTIYKIDHMHPCPKCGGKMDLTWSAMLD